MRNKLIMKYPASWYGEIWREAIPVGNGEIGGLVYGGVHHEIITINHGKLWWKYMNCELPDVSYVLPKMRELLMENKVTKAERLMCDELKRLNYTGSELGLPLSLCDIDVITHYKKPFKNYSRELDMEKGVATVNWNEDEVSFKREFFISRVNDTAFYKITSTKDYDGTFALKVHDLQTIGNLNPPENQKTVCENGYIYYSAQKDDGTYFGAVCCIKHNGTEVYESGKIRINASEIQLALKVFINSETECFHKLKKELEYDFCYEEELKKHSQIHSKLFNSVTFQINGDNTSHSNEELLMDAYQNEASDELTEKMWSFGRYLLISATREKGYPCQLYGLWSGHWNPTWPWNMFNVNIEIIYWQALSGNMPEALLSVFDYIDSQLDDYRENAKKLYGARGINICSVTTPASGQHKLLYPHILHWTGGAGWIAQHYFDYFLCTRDMDFLKKRAMPFMYEAMLFYEDFLFTDKNGYFVFAPSTSPENVPKNVREDLKSKSQIAVNSTMDFAILKELLTNIINGAEITGMYGDKVELWKEMLKKIPPYEINSDGAIKEWMHPYYTDNYEHRHESHLYPVFPGNEITRNNNPMLYKAFENALEKRKKFGLKDQTGWSLSYMANVYARLGRGDEALEVLSLLTKSNVMNNFFTVHNDWRRMGIASCGELDSPVQLDANMGFTAAVNEMFLFSTQKEIYLFNALPKKWKEGKIGPLLSKTNTEILFYWNENRLKVEMRQLITDIEVNVILPENMVFADTKNNIRSLNLKNNCEICMEIEKKQ